MGDKGGGVSRSIPEVKLLKLLPIDDKESMRYFICCLINSTSLGLLKRSLYEPSLITSPIQVYIIRILSKHEYV